MAGAKANILDDERQPICPDLDTEIYRRLFQEEHFEDTHGAKGGSREKQMVAKSAADPAYFIFNFCRTTDPHDSDKPIKPFPRTPELRALLADIHSDDPIVAVAKSRQLMVSWLLCAYAVWLARFRPHQHIFIQSMTADDTYEFVYTDWMTSRCGFIEASLPPAFWINERGTFVRGAKGKLIYPQGSQIRAMPKGAHKFRGKVGSLVIMDECCFMDEFEDSYTSALAMVKGGGRLRMVSTARNGTWFGSLIEADQFLDMVA